MWGKKKRQEGVVIHRRDSDGDQIYLESFEKCFGEGWRSVGPICEKLSIA